MATENSNLDQRMAQTEKDVATMGGQVLQIGKVLADVSDQLNRNREATERGFRELRREIRDEVAEVRAPKGQWMGIVSAIVALLGLIGGPFLVYATNAAEAQRIMEQRQHEGAILQARDSATLDERRYWAGRELDTIAGTVQELARSFTDGEPERWRRADAMAEREVLDQRLEALRELMLSRDFATGGK